MKKAILSVLAIVLAAAAWAAPSLVVSVESGAAYSQKVKIGVFSLNVIPQAAIWIETADGKFVDTIYVTKSAAQQGWTAAGGARRPESLPVWSHERGIPAPDGSYMPDKAHRLPDSISGATPKASYSKAWSIPASLAPGKYRIRVELNSSFDWNEAYPDKLAKSDPRWSEVNGQPSIVWEGVLELGRGASKADLFPAATGDLRGESGATKAGTKGLTTALALAAAVKAEYRP